MVKAVNQIDRQAAIECNHSIQIRFSSIHNFYPPTARKCLHYGLTILAHGHFVLIQSTYAHAQCLTNAIRSFDPLLSNTILDSQGLLHCHVQTVKFAPFFLIIDGKRAMPIALCLTPTLKSKLRLPKEHT